MDSKEIVEAVDEALRRANAPICYIHRTGKEGPYAVVIELNTLNALVPEDYGVLDELWLNHGHIEGDEDEHVQDGNDGASKS